MRFYYWSFLNWIPITIFYVIAAVVLWILWRLIKGDKNAKHLIWGLIPVMLILPWTEELWIAGQFDRLCKKDAGIFVYKTVEVDGFYDDTAHWWRQLAESDYQFMESRDNTYGGLYRVERDSNKLKHFEIKEPTARYQFFMGGGRDIGHKLARQESRVVDAKNNETIAEYRVYVRKAPWFFVGLDRPNMGCDSPDGGPHSKYKNTFLIYRDVLKPAAKQGVENK